MGSTLELQLVRTVFDQNFIPNPRSRHTTNLVNLSKNPESRERNIRLLFEIINRQLNKMLGGNSPRKDRYEVQLQILTTLARFKTHGLEPFPISEMLQANVLDTENGMVLDGPLGFNLSSYLRDYDFNVILPKILRNEASIEEKETFGDLHGILYRLQFKEYSSFGLFDSPAIIAISVSSRRTYRKTGKVHPVLGMEYAEMGAPSLTAKYFQKMGLEVKYYKAPGMVAPLAFYHQMNGLESRSLLHLTLLIAVMDTLQKIYRPEIYATNEPAGDYFTPSLHNPNYTRMPIHYDRDERDFTLIARQAKYVQENFLTPYQDQLKQWSHHSHT